MTLKKSILFQNIINVRFVKNQFHFHIQNVFETI